MQTDFIWHGTDREGIASFIARDQWDKHVAKRAEIGEAIGHVMRAMASPERVEPDRNRLDEKSRYFRLLMVSANDLRAGYDLRVSVKYVKQSSGVWFKFYQSCWFERSK